MLRNDVNICTILSKYKIKTFKNENELVARFGYKNCQCLVSQGEDRSANLTASSIVTLDDDDALQNLLLFVKNKHQC